MQVKAAYAKDPSSLKSEYKNGEFKFYVEYGEGKRMDMDELSAGIQGLDPSVRTAINLEKDVFVKRMSGITKTIIDEQYEVDRAAGVTGVIRGPQVVEAQVEKDVRLKASSSEDGFNFVQDQFNNNVSIGPKAKAQIFESVAITTGDKEELFNGANLLKSINDIKDTDKRAKALDAFNLILDVPLRDKENINKLKKVMLDAGANNDDLNYIEQGLEEFQIKAVSKQISNDVLATGVDSKYIAAPRYATSFKGRGSDKKTGTGKQVDSSTSRTSIINYAQQKGIETGSIINSLSSRILNNRKQQQAASKNPFLNAPTFNSSFDDLPEVTNIKIGNTVKQVQRAQADQQGNIKITYWANKPDKSGDVIEQDVSYNIYDPNSMRKFYSATATEGGASGKEPMKLYSSQYDQAMINQYTSPQGIMTLATDSNMSKWLNFVIERGGDNAKLKMLSAIAANPGIVNMQSPEHWRNFAKVNAAVIDNIKMYNELNSKS